jgi:hypothetical protein
MPTFEFKNLPKGFEYPLTKREIRELVKRVDVHFQSVEFSGISMSESWASWCTNFHVGILKAHRTENTWAFSLEMNGLRSERYSNHREEIALSLANQIENWVGAKLRLPPTAPEKPTQLFLGYDTKKDFTTKFEVD